MFRSNNILSVRKTIIYHLQQAESMKVEHTGKQLEDGGHPPIQAVRPGTPLWFLHRMVPAAAVNTGRLGFFFATRSCWLQSREWAEDCPPSSHLNLPLVLVLCHVFFLPSIFFYLTTATWNLDFGVISAVTHDLKSSSSQRRRRLRRRTTASKQQAFRYPCLYNFPFSARSKIAKFA